MIPSSTMVRNRFNEEEAAQVQKNMGHAVFLGPKNIPFHLDCEAIFAKHPSKWGVDRNVGFVEKESRVWNGGGQIARALPPMPEAAKQLPWALEVWAQTQ